MGKENNVFRVEKEGHIAWLILDRPQKLNAMTQAFFKEIKDHFTAFDADDDIRAVVIRGEGDHFTAGLDLVDAASLVSDDSTPGRETLRLKILEWQENISMIERCRKPVIAAVHGHCIGGGVDMLCACDVRAASKDALFSIRETRIAIIADLGTLQRLPHIIGHGMARELALTGRDFTAKEALENGFITHLCEDHESLIKTARELALEIASCPPLATQGVKQVMIHGRDHGVHPGLEYVAQKNAAAIYSEDLMEAFAAFMEKRPPVYKGR